MQIITRFFYSLLLLGLTAALNDDFIKKLDSGLEIVNAEVNAILKDWEVDKYPNFLRTCAMHKASLEILKRKFMKKILNAQISGKHEKFVISFTGRYNIDA